MTHFLAALLILLPLRVLAHPVIYQGGWAMSSANQEDYSNNYAMYSLTNRFAFGAEHWRFTQGEENHELGLAKFNGLLWRDNGVDYQANLYLHGGAGALDLERGNRGTHGSFLLGAEADWETRVLYTSIKHYQFHAPGKFDLFATQGRVGVSPIEADFKSLQSWFMIQAMVIDEIQERVMITPMLRFFYHNVLWEFGSSTRGEWMLNLMVHL